MNKGIKKIEIEGDGIYIRKSFDGYRIVHPIKNEDGTWNWKNLIFGGSAWNFIKILLFAAIILGVIFAYLHDTQASRDFIKNIDKVCTAYINEKNTNLIQIPKPEGWNMLNATTGT